MNSIARFVYEVATTHHRFKTLLSVAGAVFWYGVVALAVVFSPRVDRLFGWEMDVPIAARVIIAVVFLLPGVPMVAWSVTRFLRTRGTPIPFNPPPVFVTDGLYKFVRNPMHLGWTLVLIGAGFLMSSFTLLVVFLPVFVAAHLLYIKLVEEKELEQKFGQAYLDYKKRVPMFIPKLRSG